MKKMFMCLTITGQKKDKEEYTDSDSEDDEYQIARRERLARREKLRREKVERERKQSEEEKTQNSSDEDVKKEPQKCVTESGESEREESRRDDPNDDVIQVLDEESPESSGQDNNPRKARSKKSSENKNEKILSPSEEKHERFRLILEQRALAEESNRLRRREKREKKRMELSKYLGINAWKCDQKFLLNYGEQPEDIRERVIIIRKRNVKNERQRRIDEFVVRAELNAAARHRKKKS